MTSRWPGLPAEITVVTGERSWASGLTISLLNPVRVSPSISFGVETVRSHSKKTTKLKDELVYLPNVAPLFLISYFELCHCLYICQSSMAGLIL